MTDFICNVPEDDDKKNIDNLTKLLENFLNNHEDGQKVLMSYFKSLENPSKSYLECLKELSKGKSEVTQKHLQNINTTMNIIESYAKRNDLTKQEHFDAIKLSLETLKKSEETSEKYDKNTNKLVIASTAVVVTCIGAGIFVATRGKAKEPLTKGIQLLSRLF